MRCLRWEVAMEAGAMGPASLRAPVMADRVAGIQEKGVGDFRGLSTRLPDRRGTSNVPVKRPRLLRASRATEGNNK